MATTKRADIVVEWEIVVDDPPRPSPPDPEGPPVGGPPFDHCPACASRLVELSIGEKGPELRCLSCARIWAVSDDGLRLRTRIVIDP